MPSGRRCFLLSRRPGRRRRARGAGVRAARAPRRLEGGAARRGGGVGRESPALPPGCSCDRESSDRRPGVGAESPEAEARGPGFLWAPRDSGPARAWRGEALQGAPGVPGCGCTCTCEVRTCRGVTPRILLAEISFPLVLTPVSPQSPPGRDLGIRPRRRGLAHG